ncbi:MAG: glycosyltransferase [Solirubrobacteraceae bacterium]|nr:glycosyltransferase [Solirubrobacteraceae bacterium]
MLLARICRELDVTELIFRRTMDPGADRTLDYLPAGPSFPHNVTIIEGSLSRSEWLEQLSRAELFVAPRALEGVGVTALEAMARGAVVIALDAPTMNEYIDHEHTGMLLRADGLRDRAANAARTLGGRRRASYLASDYQDLSWARSANLEAVGAAAAEQTRKGAESWRKSWASYAELILR